MAKKRRENRLFQFLCESGYLNDFSSCCAFLASEERG